jgi:anti-sigma regulatory factor (Ser/Thr protein kinase)|tara:strand:+ start:102 stop:572 length:471 start_codon:yes stop_codon:yes gene_type:complete
MSTNHSTSTCTIQFPTSPAWFSTIRQLLSAASLQCGFTDRDSGQVAMAVDEALSNIYRHGYGGSSGKVTLQFTTTIEPTPTIHIEIEDEAEQVDLDCIRSRDLSDVKPGGLGVHLIQTVMDEAKWSKNDQHGMKLTMMKQSNTMPTTTTQRTKSNG